MPTAESLRCTVGCPRNAIVHFAAVVSHIPQACCVSSTHCKSVRLRRQPQIRREQAEQWKIARHDGAVSSITACQIARHGGEDGVGTD